MIKMTSGKLIKLTPKSSICWSLAIVIFCNQAAYASGDAVNATTGALSAHAQKPPTQPPEPAQLQVNLMCEGKPLMVCDFAQTYSDMKKKYADIETFKSDCSPGVFDSIMAGAGKLFSAVNPFSDSASGKADSSQTGATATITSAEAKKAVCETSLSEHKAELAALEKTIESDYQTCRTWITQVGQNCYQMTYNKYLSVMGADFKQLATVAQQNSIATNTAALEKAHGQATAWKEKITAWLEEYGVLMLAAIGAIVGLVMMLKSSSEKKRDEFRNTGKTAAKPNTKTENKYDTTPLPNTTTNTTNKPIVDSNMDKAFCKGSLKPLECYVTDGCDIKCISDKYGVRDYKGMAYDTTRIDQSGRPVDAASGGNTNPGASSAAKSAGVGGGGGTGPQGIPGETGNSNTADTKSSGGGGGYGYGDDGFGGSGGSFGGGSERNPASDRYNPKGLTKEAALKAAMASGPILPPTSNLFERVWTTTRTQCVRDLVICQGK